MHEEATECLYPAMGTPREPSAPPSILQRFLVDEAELSPPQKQMLYDGFVSADSRDEPSFSRHIARLANDFACLKRAAQQSNFVL